MAELNEADHRRGLKTLAARIVWLDTPQASDAAAAQSLNKNRASPNESVAAN